MTNFRKLCQELLDELQYQTNWSVAEDLQDRALAALAEPEPEAPSLKEQALEALDEEHADMRIQNYKLIRSVLESLPD